MIDAIRNRHGHVSIERIPINIIITPDTSFVGLKKFFDLNVASAAEATSLSR